MNIAYSRFLHSFGKHGFDVVDYFFCCTFCIGWGKTLTRPLKDKKNKKRFFLRLAAILHIKLVRFYYLQIAKHNFFSATSLADLPIDCPFHREPVGVDHIGDTAYGTLTQTGNYEFSKIPGNLVESGQDYAGYAQNNPLTSQAQQVFPGYQQGYQQPQSYPQEYPYGYEPQQFPGYNQYQTQQFPEYNQYQTQQIPEYNQYQTEEGYASVLPYYGEPENYYGNDNSYNQQQGDNFMSIQPYYGDQTPEQNVQYEFVEQPQDQLYQKNEIVEAQYVNPEQENDFTHVVEVIDNCKSNLNAIYEGACEEITEAEETAAARIEKARARVNSQSFEDFGLESYSGKFQKENR